MDKQQITLIMGSLAMILLLYFGFNTKPPKQRLVEKSRAGEVELQETQNAVREAKTALPEDLRKYIQGLENVADGAEQDSTRSEALQELSATWFDQKAAYLRILCRTAPEPTRQLKGNCRINLWRRTDATGSKKPELAMAGSVRCFEMPSHWI
jgi:hypothetical protein